MSRIDHSLLGETRSSGVLLHPTSLPGRYGIGTLGPEAEQFIDFLALAGQRLWQVLPVGSTGYGDSPYQGFSAFAGNPNLIALEPLEASGLLEETDLAGWREHDSGDPTRVDFRAVIPWKKAILQKAFSRFQATAPSSQRASLDRFRNDDAPWVTDYALFMALKELHEGVGWPDWQKEFRDRDPEALLVFAVGHAEKIDFHVFVQWIFHEQWHRLRRVATKRGISLIGDIPIFVSPDSADVWADRSLYQLDDAGVPTVVAGVPPDYFSETGQLWGNPIYRWENHEKTGFEWWQKVLISRFDMFDYIRVDHFRGFCAYWAVPFGELMDRFGFPGMKVLQFGFDEKEENDHLPHGYVRNSVAYTGTHDNDTVLGWFAKAKKAERALALRYLASDGEELHWDFIRGASARTQSALRENTMIVGEGPYMPLIYSVFARNHGSGGLAEAGVAYNTEQDLFAAFDLCHDYGTYPELRAVHDGTLSLPAYLSAKQAKYASLPAGRGARGDRVTIRSLGPSVVAIEWGSRRRSSVTVDLAAAERPDESWKDLPGLIPTGARHIHDQELAPGISLVSYSLISGSGPAREEGV